MCNLHEKKCIPCSGETPPLENLLKQKYKDFISNHWELRHNEQRLYRRIKSKDFATSLKLANKIGKLAQEQWHHPELTVSFGHLDIEIWTHKIDNLVESDFIFASKVDLILKEVDF